MAIISNSKQLSLILLLLCFCFLLSSSPDNRGVCDAARTLSILPSQQGYSKVLATLGMVCKCCDGGDCASSWTGHCSQLQCLPWKLS